MSRQQTSSTCDEDELYIDQAHSQAAATLSPSLAVLFSPAFPAPRFRLTRFFFSPSASTSIRTLFSALAPSSRFRFSPGAGAGFFFFLTLSGLGALGALRCGVGVLDEPDARRASPPMMLPLVLELPIPRAVASDGSEASLAASSYGG